MALESVYADVTATSYEAGYYDSINEDYRPVLQALLPPGLAWRWEVDSDGYNLLRALSYSFTRVAERALDLIEEIDPRTTHDLISDWERVLDLPGTNPTPPTTLAGRRAAVHGKLLGFGDPTAAFFEELAAGIGYSARVKHKHYNPFVPGSPVGDPLTQSEWKYYWVVVTMSGSLDDLLEWTIESLAPAHTRVGFEYLAATTWEQRFFSDNWRMDAVAHNQDDVWIAVGVSDGTDAQIIKSTDGGVWWYEKPNPQNIALWDIAYHDGRWVAVGHPVGGDSYLITSDNDGDTWDERDTPTNDILYGVAHNGIDRWVAVGNLSGGYAIILTSDDGVTWTRRTNTHTQGLWGIAYGNGRWVAVGETIATILYTYSSDDNGVTWTQHATGLGSSTRMNSVAFHDGLFVAVGQPHGGQARILTSPDGQTWTERANPKSFELWDVAVINGLWVAVGAADGGDAYMLKSTDGITWTTELTNDQNFDLRGIGVDQFGRFIAVGDVTGAGPYIVASTD